MCRKTENVDRYKSIKNKAKKATSKVMRGDLIGGYLTEKLPNKDVQRTQKMDSKKLKYNKM